jgi:hypothetical protein
MGIAIRSPQRDGKKGDEVRCYKLSKQLAAGRFADAL